MKICFSSLVLILCYCCIVGAVEDKIIAVVNNEAITQSEFEEFFGLMYMDLRTKYDADELDKQKGNLYQTTLSRLIEDRLILQEARRQELNVRDQEVNQRFDEVKSGFSSQTEFENILLSQGLSPGSLKEQLKDQLLMQAIIDKEVRSKIKVSPSEVTAYYRGHIDEFRMEETRYLDSIFVKDKALADKILGLIKEGIDFTGLMQQYSEGPNLGLVTQGQLLIDIEDVIFSLEVGSVSDIVKTEGGFYIFKLIRDIPARPKELSEVQDEIFSLLQQKKLDARYKEWLDGLKKNAYISIKKE